MCQFSLAQSNRIIQLILHEHKSQFKTNKLKWASVNNTKRMKMKLKEQKIIRTNLAQCRK